MSEVNFNVNDFDVKTIIQVQKDHEDDLARLSARIELLEARLGDPLKLAETLYDVSQKAIKMEDLIVEKLIKSIDSNEKVIKTLNQFITKSDRAAVHLIVKRSFVGIGAIFLALISGAIGRWL